MQYKNKKYRKPYKNKILLIVVGLLTIACLLLVLEKTGVINLYEKSPSEQQNSSSNGINLNPPTEEELQAVEENKNKLSDEMDRQQNTPPAPTEGNKTTVTPIIGFIEITDDFLRSNGFISTTIEAGGTCTLTVVKGTQTAKTSTTSLPDAQSTVCGLMQISTGELSSGEWTATLSYSSEKYEGVSDAQKFEVR